MLRITDVQKSLSISGFIFIRNLKFENLYNFAFFFFFFTIIQLKLLPTKQCPNDLS